MSKDNPKGINEAKIFSLITKQSNLGKERLGLTEKQMSQISRDKAHLTWNGVKKNNRV